MAQSIIETIKQDHRVVDQIVIESGEIVNHNDIDDQRDIWLYDLSVAVWHILDILIRKHEE